VTKRLLQHINKKDIIRLHASSRVMATILSPVKEVSNAMEGKFPFSLL